MTDAQASEERPFLSAMEREPLIATPGYHDVTVSVLDSLSKRAWRASGFVEHLIDMVVKLSGRVRALASQAAPERGAPDYEERSYERGMRDGAKYAGPNMPGSIVNGNSKILTALVALNTALLVGIGGWLLATVSRHDREIAVLECQISPTCAQAVVRGRTP